MINTAIKYIESGLSVLPAFSKSKYVPYGFRWKKYQSEKLTPDQILNLFGKSWKIFKDDKAESIPDGIAIITGKISGGLEVIDFDNSNGNIKQVFSNFCKIPELKKIINGMPAETTQSGGYHLFYRCSEIEGNKKIAQVLINGKPTTIIETRSEGGLIIAAPSNGYKLLGKSDLTKIKTITPEERKILHEHLYSFNEYTRPDQSYHHDTFNSTSEKPGNAYNSDPLSIDESKTLLIDAGWRTKNGTYWTRPGKKSGVSSTFGKCTAGGIQLFYCFSSNASPFEDRKSYTPFQILAILKHNGDFSEAAKELASKGYGKQSNPQYKQIARQIHTANKKGVKQKEAAAQIESDIPDDQIKELTKKIYEENQDEHGFDKKPNIEKAEIFLRKNYEFRRNVVTQIVEMRTHSKWEDLNVDSIFRNLQYNHIKFSMDGVKSLMKSDFVKDFDPFKTYFEELPDYTGENYFLQFAEYFYKDERKEFLAIMLRKHFVRAIKCAIEPDYYNRIVFTFFSKKQDIGKSWLINWFNPFGQKYYTDEFLKDNKDSLFSLAENFVYNLEELDTLSKMELGKLKATISKRGIKDRPAYGYQKVFMPRRCTFFGSTNREEFLVDDSNTRWMVFKTDSIDWKYSKEMDVHDLWAEAYAFYRDKDFDCDLNKEEKAWRDEENEKYQIIEVERSMIIKHFKASENDQTFMTNSDVMLKLGELAQGRIRLTTTPQKIGRIISALGFKSAQRRVNNKNTRVYYIESIPEGFTPNSQLEAPF